LKKRGTLENLKSFYIFETPSFEKGGLGRISKCLTARHYTCGWFFIAIVIMENVLALFNVGKSRLITLNATLF